MPDAAKAHTKAGAKAFVKYFWEVVNYAQATGDTESIAALSDPSCVGCSAGIDSIDRVYEKGGWISGGENRIGHPRITLGWVKQSAVADATFDVFIAPQVVHSPSGARPDKARHSHDRFTLVARSDASWKVTDFRVAK